MEPLNYLNTIILLGGLLLLYYLINNRLHRLEDHQDQEETFRLLREWMKQTLEQTSQTRREMQDRLDKSGKNINERLDNAAKVISQVNKELGEIGEIGRQMKSLQDFLKSPKLRGNIGEQVLKDLLKQHLSHAQFKMQHTFQSGATVDAAIITEGGIIPVDAKFPMESFQRLNKAETEEDEQRARRDFVNHVRKHIRDISKKYILPAEGTVNYALMYIPSEAVAYEITVHLPELNEYARRQRVYVTSPNQFNAFLQTIILSMEGRKIEEKARQIMTQLQAIQKDSEEFEENFRVLLKHVTNAKSKADEVSHDFNRLSGKIDSIQQLDARKTETLAGEETLL